MAKINKQTKTTQPALKRHSKSTMRKQFENLRILIIESNVLKENELQKLRTILNDNKVFHQTITSKDVLDKDDFFSKRFSHILSNTVRFPDYEFTQENYVPVVTADFIYAIEATGKQPTVRAYSPDPAHVLKKVHLCIGNLPASDKEVIFGGVRALGGIFNEDLNKFVTHIISIDPNEDCCIAVRALEGFSIKIVKPEWIVDCLRLRKHVNERPYLLFPDDSDDIDDPLQEVDVVNENLTKVAAERIAAELDDILLGKVFYLNSDYEFTEKSISLTSSLIERSGGSVTTVLGDANCYIGKYREGVNYISASKNSLDVGNLNWLYWMVSHRKWIYPSIKLLHYPIVRGGLPDMTGFSISSTNYSGDARFYIKELVEALGARFTSTLTKQDTHLIVANTSGKKYDHALKWKVNIVNHLWLEETYAKWKLQPENHPKYSHYPQNLSLNQIVGQTNLDPEVLASFYGSTVPEATTTHIVEDSEDERLSPIKKSSNFQVDDSPSSPINEHEPTPSITKKVGAASDIASITPSKEAIDSSIPKSTPITPHSRALADLSTNSIRVSSGRKAKDKAAAKLHSDMEDLNLFQKQHKTKGVPLLPEEVEERKRKREEELAAKEANKSSIDKSDKREETKSKKARKSISREASPFSGYDLDAITTGWENTLSKTDTQILKNLGINLFKELKPSVNAIISPKFMRTEKFLTGLSHRLKYILSPTFIEDVLTQFKSDPNNNEELPDIEEYSVDHTNPTSVREITSLTVHELLSKSQQRIDSNDKVFQNLTFNISAKLPGGAPTITKILRAHGAKDIHVIKNIKDLKNKNSIKPSQDGSRILISSEKEKGLLEKAEEVMRTVPMSTIVEWDWVVTSIFSMDATHSDHVLYQN